MDLFIQSKQTLEVGSINHSFRDTKCKLLKGQPYRVIRKATREEWIDCLVYYGEERAHAEMLSRLDPYFYEILVD